MRKNQIALIKARQAEEAQKTGTVSHQTARQTGKTATAAHKQLAHFQAAMAADLASLKALNTLDEKQAAKKTMLEKYRSFVNDYVSQAHNYPNSIAVQVMIWLLDTGDIENGLNLGLHLAEQGQIMPVKFDRRDIETFLCDALYDWANDLLKKQQSASPYLDILAAKLPEWGLHPAVTSKVYVMLAKHKKQAHDWTACYQLCELAEQANPEGAGVKTLKAEAFTKTNSTGSLS